MAKKTSVVIGPVNIAKFRALDTKNRHRDSRRVTKYAHDMERNRFLPDINPLIIRADGTLADGGHRLEALERTGKSYRFTVVTLEAHDEWAEDVIDTGRARSAGDVLALHGYSRGPEKSSVVRMLLLFDEDSVTSTGLVNGQITKWGHGDILAAYEREKDLIDRAVEIGSACQDLLTRRYAGFLFVLFARKSREDAEAFFSTLLENLYSDKGSPIYQLHNRLIALNRVSRGGKGRGRGRVEDFETIKVTAKAWNLWKAGRTCERLVLKPQDEGILSRLR